MGGKLTLLADFWSDYARIGRCAIDTDHSRHFIGGDTRWAVSGDIRSCLWCEGHTQTLRRWTETVERERWEPTTASSVGTSACASEPNPTPTGSKP